MLVYLRYRMAGGEGSSARLDGDVTPGGNLFRMRDDVFDIVGFADYGEIETPVAVDSGLPGVGTLIVFFRLKGRMREGCSRGSGAVYKTRVELPPALPSVPR
jgi:hypothetical protein